MEMPKPTEADKERFRSLVPDAAGVEVKPMFGNLAAFVNGNIFLCLLGADVAVKLDHSDAEALTAKGGGPFGPGEKPMTGYVALPAAWQASPAKARPWIDKALASAAALPPKAPKAAKKKKA